MKKSKAKVYIWPGLPPDDAQEVEVQCALAGYRHKRKVKVGRVVCLEVT